MCYVGSEGTECVSSRGWWWNRERGVTEDN